MNTATLIKYVTLVGKISSIVVGLGEIPMIPQQYGILIFAIASTLKDVTNRIGDWLDNGKADGSFKAS